MRRVDLNLLYVLRELLKEPNTTRVGERLGLTQSSVSAALGRLRWAFQDELFVRSGRSLAPTRKAESLLEPVEHVISCIESLVEEVRFDPDSLARTFTLVSADFMLATLVGPLIASMYETAPRTRLVSTHFLPDTRDRIRSGHLDIMIGPRPSESIENEIDRLSFQALYTDHLVAAVASDNPGFGDRLTEAELMRARHLDFNPSFISGWTSQTRLFLSQQGLRFDYAAEFSSQMLLMRALGASDALAIVPLKLVELGGAQAGVRFMELPIATPEFEVSMIWNRSFDNDPEHQWFRSQIEEVCNANL